MPITVTDVLVFALHHVVLPIHGRPCFGCCVILSLLEILSIISCTAIDSPWCVRAAEDDALLPEEEASGIVETFPGLSPPIPSPTEPTVTLQQSQRCSPAASNPLRMAFDFSKPENAPAPPYDAAVGSWPLDAVAEATALSERVPEAARSPASDGTESGDAELQLSGGVSDLSLPRAAGSSPGVGTPTPRGSAHAYRNHERPWDSVYTHDNALFSDQSPTASGGTSAGVRATPVTPVSAQKIPEACDADMARDAAHMPSPDENSSENLPFLSK